VAHHTPLDTRSARPDTAPLGSGPDERIAVVTVAAGGDTVVILVVEGRDALARVTNLRICTHTGRALTAIHDPAPVSGVPSSGFPRRIEVLIDG
jgi:hypothetical protein